jgi:hydroxylamine reductase (hybrid-cluster protein)
MPNMIDELSAVDEEESAHDSDEKSHMTSESPTGHTSKGGSISEEQEIKNRVIKEEETDVRRARILVGTAFLACAVAVSVAVNLFAKKSNQQSFEIEVSQLSCLPNQK